MVQAQLNRDADSLDPKIREQLQNQHLDILSELGKWDEIVTQVDKTSLSFHEQDRYLKACIRQEDTWPEINA